MSVDEEHSLELLLKKHIVDSVEWRKQADIRMDDMQECIKRHNRYEVGANAIIWVGKALIFIGGAIGGAWIFLNDFLNHNK